MARPKNTSPVPYLNIIDKFWPKVLEGQNVYADEIIEMMIADEMLVKNHRELTGEKSDPERRVYHERKENQHFHQLNRHLQAEKYYRFFRRPTVGGRVRLDFQNDGVYHQERIIRLPIQALRTHANSTKAMERQEGFVDEDKRNFLDETQTVLIAASRSFEHIKTTYIKKRESNEPKVTPIRKKAAAKKAGRPRKVS